LIQNSSSPEGMNRLLMYENIKNYDPISIFPEDGLSTLVEIVILVITRWHDIASRTFLRNTLGFTNKSQEKSDIKLLFVFGIPKNASNVELAKIKEENNEYQDMIIPAVEDNYHTVGFKLISAFNWIFDASNATEDSNLKWILKMDDDVLLNTKELKNYIDGIGRNDTDSIYCRVYTKAKAIREKKARAKDKNLEKWAVSKEEYPYKIYPPYCQGALYLFDIHTSEQLCHLFEMELHRNYVWIEDVFITGILAFLGDIKLINIESQLFNNEMTHKFPINVKKYKKKSIAIFTENWTPEEREEQFGVLFQGRTLKNVNTTTSSERKIANSTSDWKKEDSVNDTLISLCISLGNC